MNHTSDSDDRSTKPARQGVALWVLIVLLAVAAIGTAATTVGVLQLTGRLQLGGAPLEVFEQRGNFRTAAGQEGDVKFPIPYASAPNVELSGSSWNVTIIVETTALGFRWKNSADLKDRMHNDSTLNWTAKGVRATAIPR